MWTRRTPAKAAAQPETDLLFYLAHTLGGMTASELAARMSVDELHVWAAWLEQKAAREKKEMDKARAQAKTKRR
jgi:hypothetical protein